MIFFEYTELPFKYLMFPYLDATPIAKKAEESKKKTYSEEEYKPEEVSKIASQYKRAMKLWRDRKTVGVSLVNKILVTFHVTAFVCLAFALQKDEV